MRAIIQRVCRASVSGKAGSVSSGWHYALSQLSHSSQLMMRSYRRLGKVYVFWLAFPETTNQKILITCKLQQNNLFWLIVKVLVLTEFEKF